MRTSTLLLASLVACGGGSPEIRTVALPDGTVGETYALQLIAVGGKDPSTWSLAGGALPDGLVLNPAGAISGVPTTPGEFAIDLVLTDAKGREDRSPLDLTIAYDADSLVCGDELVTVSEGGGVVDFQPVFDAPSGVTWVQIPLPAPEVTRIDLGLAAPTGGFTLYELGLPGTQPGETDPEAYVALTSTWNGQTTEAVDLGTVPDLDVFRASGDPLVLAVLTEEASDVTVSSACSDGPVFTSLRHPPTLVGEPIGVNYNVHGDGNPTTRIWTDDALPEGVSMDERGRMSGVLDEPGVWPFTLRARDEEGRERSETTWLTSYVHRPLACGESASFEPLSPFWSGDLYQYYDPRSYAVYEVSLPVGVSRVQATVFGTDDVEIGTSAAGSPSTFYATRSVDGPGTATITVDPGSWPPVQDYLDVQDTLYFQAWHNDYGARDPVLEVDITCSTAPRLGQTALPVIRPAARTEHTLPAFGGEGAVSWSADGLPSGLALSSGGVLAGTTSGVGSWDVELTLEDAAGQQSVETLPLHVGWDSACQGSERLRCGESVSGVFDTDLFDRDAATADYMNVFCLPEAGANNRVSLTITGEDDARIEASTYLPGRGLRTDYAARDLSENGRPEVIVIGESSDPTLHAWTHQPLFVLARAWEPGPWSLDVRCE